MRPKVVKGVRVGILGPLEVRDVAGQPAPLAGPRLRALLIRLALAGGHTVTVDRLASDLDLLTREVLSRS
jgi:DNA-binding SARP family transcriptional activator